MNKTITINLGGILFHIDENAYEALQHYFEKIKRSLNDQASQDEVMNDIEIRVSELLLENRKSEMQIATMHDIEKVITVMGQPEDYRLDSENEGEENSEKTKTNTENKQTEQNRNESNNSSKRTTKKPYRDLENGMIGGVLSGLGYFFGVDRLWLRIILVLLFLAFGSGFLIYIILWILLPEAKTTSEKLEMKGEPVTISNIEKNVKKEYERVSDSLKAKAEQLKNGEYAEYRDKVIDRVGKVGTIFRNIFTVFGKIIGVFITVFSSIILFTVLVASVMLIISNTYDNFGGISEFHGMIGFDIPIWAQGFLFLFLAGIPFFFLLFLGIRILNKRQKSMPNSIRFTLIAVWILAFCVLIAYGIKLGSQFAYKGNYIVKTSINIDPKDTLSIEFVKNRIYTENGMSTNDFMIEQGKDDQGKFYFRNVHFEVIQTKGDSTFIEIIRKSQGSNLNDADNRAKNIEYAYKIEKNKLFLNDYLTANIDSKFRFQEVYAKLYLAKDVIVKYDNSNQILKHYTRNWSSSDNDFKE